MYIQSDWITSLTWLMLPDPISGISMCQWFTDRKICIHFMGSLLFHVKSALRCHKCLLQLKEKWSTFTRCDYTVYQNDWGNMDRDFIHYFHMKSWTRVDKSKIAKYMSLLSSNFDKYFKFHPKWFKFHLIVVHIFFYTCICVLWMLCSL
jgi:hypothetical protein